MLKLPIYLDNQATTQVDPRVFEAMKPYFTEIFGNASSKSHRFGWMADAAVKKARKQVATLIGCTDREIIFTNGSTESNNLAIKGTAEANVNKGNHIITCVTEHPSVLDVCRSLEIKDFEITYLQVDKFGMLNLDELKRSFTAKTILVSIMFANNEIGTIHPIEEIGKICKENNVLFHTDATQGIGKLKVSTEEMNIDLLSLSAHKFNGPKGIGALFIRNNHPKIRINSQLEGGGQERGYRSGTLNVSGIVGLGEACELASKEMQSDKERIEFLRDKLYEGLKSNFDRIHLNGHPEKRLFNNLNICFDNIDSDSLMASIKDIAVSSGSACSSEHVVPSHVLQAIGLSKNLIRSSIRFGVGKFNTEEEIDYTIDRFTKEIKTLNGLSFNPKTEYDSVTH